MADAWLRTRTVAAGSTAPVASETEPCNEALVWAANAAGSPSATSNTKYLGAISFD